MSNGNRLAQTFDKFSYPSIYQQLKARTQEDNHPIKQSCRQRWKEYTNSRRTIDPAHNDLVPRSPVGKRWTTPQKRTSITPKERGQKDNYKHPVERNGKLLYKNATSESNCLRSNIIRQYVYKGKGVANNDGTQHPMQEWASKVVRKAIPRDQKYQVTQVSQLIGTNTEPERYVPTRKAVTPPPMIRRSLKPPQTPTSPRKIERNTYTSSEKLSMTGEQRPRFALRQPSPESFKYHMTTVQQMSDGCQSMTKHAQGMNKANSNWDFEMRSQKGARPMQSRNVFSSSIVL